MTLRFAGHAIQRFQFVVASVSSSSLFTTLDLSLASDLALLVVSRQHGLSSRGEAVLRFLSRHGLPPWHGVVQHIGASPTRRRDRASKRQFRVLRARLETLAGAAGVRRTRGSSGVLHVAGTSGTRLDQTVIVRWLTSAPLRSPTWRVNRPYCLCELWRYQPTGTVTMPSLWRDSGSHKHQQLASLLTDPSAPTDSTLDTGPPNPNHLGSVDSSEDGNAAADLPSGQLSTDEDEALDSRGSGEEGSRSTSPPGLEDGFHYRFAPETRSDPPGMCLAHQYVPLANGLYYRYGCAAGSGAQARSQGWELPVGTLVVVGYLRGAPLHAGTVLHLPGLCDLTLAKIEVLDRDPVPRITARRARWPETGSRPGLDTDGDEDAGAGHWLLRSSDAELAAASARSPAGVVLPEPGSARGFDDVPKGAHTIRWSELLQERVKLTRRPAGTGGGSASASMTSWIRDGPMNSVVDTGGDGAGQGGSFLPPAPPDDPNASLLSRDIRTVYAEGEPIRLMQVTQAQRRILQKVLAASVAPRFLAEAAAFPDEVTLPPEVLGQLLYGDYRGLSGGTSLQRCRWHPKENLPPDYARIAALGGQFHHVATRVRVRLGELYTGLADVHEAILRDPKVTATQTTDSDEAVDSEADASAPAKSPSELARFELNQFARLSAIPGSLVRLTFHGVPEFVSTLLQQRQQTAQAAARNWDDQGQSEADDDDSAEGVDTHVSASASATGGSVGATEAIPSLDFQLTLEQLVAAPPLLGGLLPLEHKVSVVHFDVRLIPEACPGLLPARTMLWFIYGWRRVRARALFSQLPFRHAIRTPPSTGPPKHRALRLLVVQNRGNKTDSTGGSDRVEPLATPQHILISAFAPVSFDRQAVSVALKPAASTGNSGPEHDPVSGLTVIATGSVYDCNPDRLIIERALLSGVPRSIKKQTAMVRHMFHSPLDVKFFRPLRLTTRFGARGRILAPRGTRGEFKALFDRPLRAGDTIFLPLYRRIFPPWPLPNDDGTDQFCVQLLLTNTEKGRRLATAVAFQSGDDSPSDRDSPQPAPTQEPFLQTVAPMPSGAQPISAPGPARGLSEDVHRSSGQLAQNRSP